MTFDELLVEGRALQRPCWFLLSNETGKPVGVWHSSSKDDAHRWLTVDMTGYANVSGRYMSVVSNASGGGNIEFSDQLPKLSGGDVELVARAASVLPPIDAVFAFGSDAIGSWLAENRWERGWGYNSNFADREPVEQYERAYQSEHPLYGASKAVAMIGGWHFPFPDDDWSDLATDELLLMTFKDAEPWVEAWKAKDGSFKVVQRVT